jgi:hypothetical protein
MAYQPCRCSVTLLCPVCISVFCTPLTLSVLLPFMLYVPYPFNAPFLDCAFLLLRSASLHTPELSYTTTTPISSLFNILIVSVVFVHAIFTMPLHAHSMPNSSTTRVLCLIIIVTLQLLWPFSHSFSITGCYTRFLSLSGSLRLFIFSVTVELILLCFQLQASMLIQLSIASTNIFIPLEDSQRLFTSSVNHPEVSSSPLAETISGFWQLHCVVLQ